MDDTEIAFLNRLADAASAAILPHFRTPFAVENKLAKGFDPVTIADRAGETAMRTLINSSWPGDGIMGEEFGNERLDAERVWVLDPIDGTRAFIAGLPVWGVLIGRRDHGTPSVGMMAQPFTGERFYGDGRSAWYSGPGGPSQLRCRSCDGGIGAAIVSTTTPQQFRDGDGEAWRRVEAAARLARYGGDCYAYCMLAAGFTDAVIESGLQPYDIVPLIPVIEGAGGIVTDWQGGPAQNGGRVIASGDARLHRELLAMLAG